MVGLSEKVADRKDCLSLPKMSRYGNLLNGYNSLIYYLGRVGVMPLSRLHRFPSIVGSIYDHSCGRMLDMTKMNRKCRNVLFFELELTISLNLHVTKSGFCSCAVMDSMVLYIFRANLRHNTIVWLKW